MYYIHLASSDQHQRNAPADVPVRRDGPAEACSSERHIELIFVFALRRDL